MFASKIKLNNSEDNEKLLLANMNIYAYLVAVLCLNSALAQDSLVKSSVEDESNKSGYDVLENSINNFGLNLMKTMMKQGQDQNIVISPTSIAGLLAMCLLGSAGSTYDELSQLIGFTEDILANRMYHEDFGSRLQSLNANDTKTLYANAVFVDHREKLREVYRSYLARVYQGEASEADFSKVEEVKLAINEWVRNHTGNKIEEFLQQPLPSSTKVVLLSALYFSGQWAEPFALEHTRLLPFKTPSKEVMVDLMANFGELNYIFSYEDGIQMIALPYNDSTTSMYVMKPRFPKRMNISEMMDKLDYQKINSYINKLSKKKCVIRFPKMQLENKINLKEALESLGATSMFTPGEANFAVMLESNRISNNSEDELITRINAGEGEARTLKHMVNRFANPGVHVDAVLHEVKMTVDEYGTEAVAATSAVMARSAEMFYADSPFYLFIRNEKTKLVTFSAVVFDPSV